MAAVTICSDFGAQKNKIWLTLKAEPLADDEHKSQPKLEIPWQDWWECIWV